MKNARLLAVFAALLAAVLAFSVFAFRQEKTVRFGLAAGPQSWWACALPGYSGRAYETVVYADDAAALAALERGEIDAALVAADDFSALSAEEYVLAAAAVRRTLTLLAAPGGEAETPLAPETLRGSAEIALWAQIAPEEPVEFLSEEAVLARAREGALPRALLPAGLAAAVLMADERLYVQGDLAALYLAATGTPAPAAYAVALRSGLADRSGRNVRSLLDACASSLGYAKGNHRRAALLCARYGLDGGCDAALIRAMIPRLGYEWSEILRE